MTGAPEQFVNITFNEMIQLNADDIQQWISKEAAIRISINSKEGSEIYKFWINKLFKAFDPSKLHPDDLVELTNLFSEQIKKITEIETASEQATLNLLPLSSCLCDSLEFLKWLRPLVNELGLIKSSILFCFILWTISRFLLLYHKWHNQEQLTNLRRDSLELHNVFLQIVGENADHFSPAKPDEAEGLTKVIIQLCEIGEQPTLLDFKTVVDTWKCITKLTLQYARWSQSNQNVEHAWVKRPLVFLLQEIARNVHLVHKVGIHHQHIEQVEKYLRVTNFYVKLLERLAFTFSHSNFPACEDFMATLAVTVTPGHIIGSEIALMLDKYVSQGLCKVLNLIYRNTKIAKILLEENFKSKNEEFYGIAIELFFLVIHQRDSDYLMDHVDFVIESFLRLSRDPLVFVSKTKYSRLVEVFAALYVLCNLKCDTKTNASLQNSFVNGIFSEDFLIAATCVDVLSVVHRCSVSNKEQRLSHFQFWCKNNENFARFSYSPHSQLIQLLLQTLYRNSTQCILKSDLWEKYTDTEITESNYRFFNTIASISATVPSGLVIKLTEELFQMLENIGISTCTVDNYYKIITILQLLAPVIKMLRKELLENIISLCTAVFLSCETNFQRFAFLIEALLDFIISDINLFPEADVIRLLDLIKKSVPHLNNIAASIVKFVNETRKVLKFQQKSDEIVDILCREDLNRAVKLLLTSNQLKLTVPDKIDCLLFKDISGIFPRGHNCAGGIPAAKRMRTQPIATVDTKSTLSEIFKQTNIMVRSSVKLDSDDLALIDNIVKNLQQTANKTLHNLS